MDYEYNLDWKLSTSWIQDSQGAIINTTYDVGMALLSSTVPIDNIDKLENGLHMTDRDYYKKFGLLGIIRKNMKEDK